MTLPPHIELLIQERIDAGRYATVEETLEAAFGALAIYEEDVDEIRRGIDEGLADAEAGRVIEGEEALRVFWEGLRARLQDPAS